jgi:deaminated glutathione amidase
MAGMTTQRVAAIQMTTGPDVPANLRAAGELLEQAAAAGAILAALPENFAFMGLNDIDKRAVGETPGRGPIQDFLAETARRHKLWIVGGTMPLKRAPNGNGSSNGHSASADDGRVAAASLVFDASGQQVARYDKIHLFDVDVPGKGKEESYRESAHVAPGVEPRVVDTPIGKLGLAVCYDIRFPELFRKLSAAGAVAFVLPSAFTTPTGRAHWETLLRARAIENLSAMIAPAQSGVHPNGRETYGDSMIVDHWGRVLARLPRGTGFVVGDIDANGRNDARKNFPSLEHRVF